MIGLVGASGRMGKNVSELMRTQFSDRATLFEWMRGAPLEPLFQCDAIIDFSLPSAMVPILEHALTLNKKLPAFIIGSTGWAPEQLAVLKRVADKTPVLFSANFSFGVQWLLQTITPALSILQEQGWQVSLTETHHVHKKDAPSGTALMITERLSRQISTAPIPIQSIREGEVVGEHSIVLQSPFERITLTHSALDRKLFANGAIESTLKLVLKRHQEPSLSGLFSMEDFYKSVYGESI